MIAHSGLLFWLCEVFYQFLKAQKLSIMTNIGVADKISSPVLEIILCNCQLNFLTFVELSGITKFAWHS